MKGIMTKIPIWLLMAWPYIFFAGLFLGGSAFFGIFCILTLVLCIVNLINAKTYSGSNIARELGLWGMVTKLVHMPFYVVSFVMGLLGMLSMFADPTIASSAITLLFMLILSMLFMIISSLYCLKAVFAARDMGIVKKETAMLLGATSFIMFADVICAILIYSKIKKNKKVLH